MKIKNFSSIFESFSSDSGQSLIELILSIVIGAILIGGASMAVIPIVRSNLESRTVQVAVSLGDDYINNVKSISESSWLEVYNPPSSKGSDSQFYLEPSGNNFDITSGTTSTAAEGRTFTRYFSIENTNRDSCGVGDITSDATSSCASGPGTTGVADDPSTQKITVIVSWSGGGSAPSSINRIQYLARTLNNNSFIQTDWSGGPSQEGPITLENYKFTTSTDIDYATSTGSIVIEGF